jgi:hypothetical protein
MCRIYVLHNKEVFQFEFIKIQRTAVLFVEENKHNIAAISHRFYVDIPHLF